MASLRTFKKVRIESLVHELAPHRVETLGIEDELAATYQRLGIPKNCLVGLTGIEARRFWQEDTPLSLPATRAAEAALAKIGDVKTMKRKVGMLINTSVSKEYLEPSQAAFVHGDLGLQPGCENFDVANACLGFLTGLNLAASRIENGEITHALVIAAESSRKVVRSTIERLKAPDSTMQDYKDFLPTLTLGSGAVAVLLAHESVSTTSHVFHGTVSVAATEFNRVCLGTYDWMRTDASTLLTEGVALAKRTYRAANAAFGWSRKGVDQYINHQVGATHLATLYRSLELPTDRAYLTYPGFGNMGAAALPFTLALAVEDGTVKEGDNLAFMGIGSGLNCAMAHVTW
ncbi:MAG: 3-oxoacyl-ACP synthase III [Deltaproteobacteria bacterium]|nr:3-oxoacyl-ACP synthase III [Deltaproteobacteria bacterium]